MVHRSFLALRPYFLVHCAFPKDYTVLRMKVNPLHHAHHHLLENIATCPPLKGLTPCSRSILKPTLFYETQTNHLKAHRLCTKIYGHRNPIGQGVVRRQVRVESLFTELPDKMAYTFRY